MIDKITHQEIISYVKKNGWKDLNINSDLMVYFDDPTETVMITVPIKTKFSDYERSLLYCIDAIAKIEKCSAFMVYCKIKSSQIPPLFSIENVEEILNYLGTTKILRYD